MRRNHARMMYGLEPLTKSCHSGGNVVEESANSEIEEEEEEEEEEEVEEEEEEEEEENDFPDFWNRYRRYLEEDLSLKESSQYLPVMRMLCDERKCTPQHLILHMQVHDLDPKEAHYARKRSAL